MPIHIERGSSIDIYSEHYYISVVTFVIYATLQDKVKKGVEDEIEAAYKRMMAELSSYMRTIDLART